MTGWTGSPRPHCQGSASQRLDNLYTETAAYGRIISPSTYYDDLVARAYGGARPVDALVQLPGNEQAAQFVAAPH